MRKYIDVVESGPEVVDEDFINLGKKVAAGAAAGALAFGAPTKAGDDHPTAKAQVGASMDSIADAPEPADAPGRELLNDEGEVKESLLLALEGMTSDRPRYRAESVASDLRAFMESAEPLMEDNTGPAMVAAVMLGGLGATVGMIHNHNIAAKDAEAQRAASADASVDALLARASPKDVPVVWLTDKDVYGTEKPQVVRTTYERPQQPNPYADVNAELARQIETMPMDFRKNWAYLTMTIWGEARNQGDPGMKAVGAVVINRMNEGRWGSSIGEVVKRYKQFSCWNKGDPNAKKMWGMIAVDKAVMNDPAFAQRKLNDADFQAWLRAKQIAFKLLTGEIPDVTGGANHYHTGAVDPSWDQTMKVTKRIGDHVFFRDRG